MLRFLWNQMMHRRRMQECGDLMVDSILDLKEEQTGGPKKKIRIGFAKFPCGFNPDEWNVMRLLRQVYDFEITDQPDFLFYSIFDGDMPRGRSIKIYWCLENLKPNFDECDWAFSQNYDEDIQNPKHYRFPIYMFVDLKKKAVDFDKLREEKRKFCNFLYSHEVPSRNDFFKKLSRYKRIDSPGRCMNNQAGFDPPGFMVSWLGDRSWQERTMLFLSRYKFTVAFENTSYPGYLSEKLYHPMLVNSIPIYWGNSRIDRDFNTKSFLNYHDYPNEEAFIERIIEVDKRDDLYEQYLKEPWWVGDEPPQGASQKKLVQHFKKIFGDSIR
ncbi:MAG: hypothetical protein JW893_06455 [Candidatus Omnitrophica bacterium]|nr:hypothetical protein [Candidatus Omnitrophota bacterium]